MLHGQQSGGGGGGGVDEIPHVQAVLVGPPNSGRTAVYAMLLYLLNAFDRRFVERFMQDQRHTGYTMSLSRRLADGWVRDSQERSRGITMKPRHYMIHTLRYPLSLVHVPSYPAFYRSKIRAAFNADFALLAVSLQADEFEYCTANRGPHSLWESALLIKGLGIRQVLVIMTKASNVFRETAEESQVKQLIDRRSGQVVELLESMRFNRADIFVAVTSAYEDQGIMSPLYPGYPSLIEALAQIDIDRTELRQLRQQQIEQETSQKLHPPFRHATFRANRIGGIGTVVSGRVLSGKFVQGDSLAYYPQVLGESKIVYARARSGESFHRAVPTARSGVPLAINLTNRPPASVPPGSVGLTEEEDSKSMLQLTVTEFTVQLRAINPAQQKGGKVLSVGQQLMVHSHGAHSPCKVMAVLSVKHGEKTLQGPFFRVCRGEVATVRLRPLKPFVVEPFAKFASLGRVILHDGVTRALGRVERVVKLFKPTFVHLLGTDDMWNCIAKEPELLLGRDQDNNTLLHLLVRQSQITGRVGDEISRTIQLVQDHFGRIALQRFMRVRNSQGLLSLHLALQSGSIEAATVLLSMGAPMVPSLAEQERLLKLWKKPVPSPLTCLMSVSGRTDRRGPLNLALLCLMVLTRDREEFTNLDDMLPPKEMQHLYILALQSYVRSQSC